MKEMIELERDDNINPTASQDFRTTEKEEQEIWDMKQELEDYLEEQGIYIRQ